MPTYEYQCPDGHQFEKFQRITDKPRAKCPECGKSAIRKISGGAGLVFKGSGFYITDYGKDGKGPRKPDTDTGAASKADATSAPKGDGKPAASPSGAASSSSATESAKPNKAANE